ncbi:autotransporter assembly complex family protein [Reyranella sp.]|uniref:autotransporter assembly complex protein TamA n=1 Tax=Reyranella sp. TaxID=1929291 RepID=UPI00260005AE|nr:autotransporter assembly complex family protein [Reyranella sp.]
MASPRPHQRWLRHLLAALAAIMLTTAIAFARTGEVTLNIVGDEGMAEELRKLTKELDKDQPLTGDSLALLQGAQTRRARVATALRSKGYYDARVTATVVGQPVDEPAALDAIEQKPESDKVAFTIDVATGPVYRVVDLALQGPPDIVGYPGLDRSKLSIGPGKPADAALILATEDQILGQIRGRGYALAAVTHREVLIDHATREAHVTFTLDSGPPTRMGRVRFSGTEKVDTTYLQKRVPFEQGDPYSPAKVNALRDRLTSLGTFNSVRIKPGAALDGRGELPFDVELTDRVPRTIGFGASYETQRGFGVNGYWMHRNLFGEAESLKLSAEVNHIGQGAIPAELGYGIKIDFRKPDWLTKQQDAVANAAAVNEIFDAYHRKAVTLLVGIDQILNPQWRFRAGLSGEVSQIQRYGIWGYYSLIGLPAQVIYNRANSDVDPTEGFRLTLNAAPYADMTHSGDIFGILKLVGTAYVNISGDGRSVLAGRAAFGTIPGGTNASIPFDKLFYAGGGGSVRGFAYQSAGPRDAFNNPLGGASLVEGSIEFRQRIGESWGAVLFVDAGSSYTDTMPNFSQFAPRLGAGAGVRYYTSFGPARLDVGVPLNKRDGDAPFGVYVSIGQAF